MVRVDEAWPQHVFLLSESPGIIRPPVCSHLMLEVTLQPSKLLPSEDVSTVGGAEHPFSLQLYQQQPSANAAHNTTEEARHKGSRQELGELFILLARFRKCVYGPRVRSPHSSYFQRFTGFWTHQWASNACSTLEPRAWALVFEDKWCLHLVSHVLPHECLHNGQRKLKAGPWPAAGEDQAVLLHAAL